jgi:hypothetical protein
MNHGLRLAALAVVLSSVSSIAMAADPGREAAGWKNWADFTGNIAANVGENDYNATGVKSACKGVTGMTIGQGFQFPYWGQSVIQACQVYAELGDVNGNLGMASSSDDLLKKIFKRKKKSLCKDSERVAENLGKATAIASEPRAQQLAFDLAESMGRIYDAADCSGKKRTWSWRHEEHQITP